MFDCCFQTIRCLEFVNWKLFCFLLVLFRYIVFKKQIIYLQFYSLFFNVIIWLALWAFASPNNKKVSISKQTIILQKTYFLFNIFYYYHIFDYCWLFLLIDIKNDFEIGEIRFTFFVFAIVKKNYFFQFQQNTYDFWVKFDAGFEYVD